MHMRMLQKGPIPRKIKSVKNLSKDISAKIYTLEIYPLYGTWQLALVFVPVYFKTLGLMLYLLHKWVIFSNQAFL